MMRADPYLFFHGQCAEALEFYRKTLGAEIELLVRFGDIPGFRPETKDNVMHAALRIGETVVLASDGRAGGNTTQKRSANSPRLPMAERSRNA
jgi:PhnB protein